MKLVSVTPSDREGKKYVAIFEDPKKTVHFGFKGSQTYLDHHNKDKRANYLARHRVNENWDDPATGGSLSRHLLWGDHTSLRRNISAFKKKFNL
jgi:hypothetical protein